MTESTQGVTTDDQIGDLGHDRIPLACQATAWYGCTQGVATRFIARMVAESVAHDPEQLAAEHVRNDERLAKGEPFGKTIALALREVEHG